MSNDEIEKKNQFKKEQKKKTKVKLS